MNFQVANVQMKVLENCVNLCVYLMHSQIPVTHTAVKWPSLFYVSTSFVFDVHLLKETSILTFRKGVLYFHSSTSKIILILLQYGLQYVQKKRFL
jgi:hypothetical protein